MNLHQLLKQAHEEWLPTYQITNPLPLKIENHDPEVNWWKQYGWAFLVVIICLGLFVAARTGKGIYDANVAEGFGGWSFWLTACAVVGVEGLLVVFGFFRPRKIESGPVGQFFEKTLSWFSVSIGLFISAASGLKFFLSTSEQLGLRWSLATDKGLSLSLGVGLTLVLYGISEFAGRLKWLFDNMPSIIEHDYQKKVAEWRQSMNEAWTNSPAYLEIMGDQLVRQQQIQFDIENANRGRSKVLAAQRQAEIDQLKSRANQPTSQHEAPPVRSMVEDCLKDRKITIDDLIDGKASVSPVDLARELNVKDVSVRTALFRMREEALQRRNGNS